MVKTLVSDLPAASASGVSAEDGVELVLRGHGMLGLAHVGVLKAFAENGVRVKKLTAMSLGSVVATLYVNGVNLSEIEQLLLHRKARQVISDAWFGHGECQHRTRGEIRDLLPVAREFVAANRLQPSESLRLLCFDVVQQRTVAFEGTDYDLATALAACCSVSGVLRPVRRGDKLLVDCSLHGCKLLHPCMGASFVADVTLAGELPDKALSAVDRFLHRRSRLIAPESACTDVVRGGGARIISVVIPVRVVGNCECSGKAMRRIIAAGYKAAMNELHSVRLTEQAQTDG